MGDPTSDPWLLGEEFEIGLEPQEPAPKYPRGRSRFFYLMRNTAIAIALIILVGYAIRDWWLGG